MYAFFLARVVTSLAKGKLATNCGAARWECFFIQSNFVCSFCFFHKECASERELTEYTTWRRFVCRRLTTGEQLRGLHEIWY
jgi:hypothetical protein